MYRQSFNDGWELVRAAGGLMGALMGGGAPNLPVQLPHDAMIHETPVREALSGAQTGFYPGGEYTYEKKFDVPAQWSGRDVILSFGGVYQTAMVYVNGDFAASSLHGYGGFDVSIDPFLRFGEENTVKVIANNPTPNSRWYSGSGIYRGVELYVGGDVHILKDGVRITTKETGPEWAVAEVETRLANITRERRHLRLVTGIYEAGCDSPVERDALTVTVYPRERETLRQTFSIPEPKLWDCEHPNLYDVRVEVYDGETLLDTETVRTGLRVLSLDGRRGLRLNGKPVKQRGTCIHHDNGILGDATFPAAEEKRAREIRAAGFNAVRSAHHPMSREMLAACDKYGLLVMDELSDMWNEEKNRNDFSRYFDRCWEEEAEKMVAKDYNHPCVILYSSGNEILDLGRESGGPLNRRICNKFHALDSTRFTTTACNGLIAASIRGVVPQLIGAVLQSKGIDPASMAPGAGTETAESGVGAANMMMSLMDDDLFASHPLMTEALEEAAQASDIAGFNYLTGRHALEGKLHPNKPVLGTETYPADIVRLWRIVEENDHVLGDYTWTGYDYLGEAGCGIFYYDGTVNFSSHFPDRLAYIGDIDILGNRRPISYLREIVFGLRSEPYIAVVRVNHSGEKAGKTSWMLKDNVCSWTWPGCEGRTAEVDVYSPDEEVELFLNGVSLGRKPAGRDHGFTAGYELPYAPGELKAVGYRGGKETGSFTLATASEQVRLSARADRTELPAGKTELAFVKICLTDSEGRKNLFARKTVQVSVSGAGALQAFGSADPQPTRSYDEDTWETYDGEVMAAIRSDGTPGTITVRFSAEGCEDAVVTIEATA